MWPLFVGIAVALARFSAPVVPPAPVLIRAEHVLDPSGEKWLDHRTVLISDGKISRISDESIATSSDAIVIDGTGFWLMPGLIDLHSHLLLHPYNEKPWNSQVLFESLETRTIRATVAAHDTLIAGFTTLRDLGTEGAGFADVALREAIQQRLIPGPRLYVVTRAIVARGCYGPTSVDSRWEFPQGAQEANGADGVRAAVREQIAHGADWIKVYADYSRGLDSEATPTFSQDELNALVDEARAANRSVAAHATTDEGIRRAVLAGVKTIEHGYGAGEATLKLMRERGVVLCPTLAASDAVARYGGWNGLEPAPPRVAQSRAAFKAALRGGVTIANGSDVGVFAHGDNARELELMVNAGLTPVQALQSATAGAATVLGKGDSLGRIDVGFAADLVLLGHDPLVDISAVRDVRGVMKGGVFVKKVSAD
jgi:imidazolonepropionase-like amidohydrolase